MPATSLVSPMATRYDADAVDRLAVHQSSSPVGRAHSPIGDVSDSVSSRLR